MGTLHVRQWMGQPPCALTACRLVSVVHQVICLQQLPVHVLLLVKVLGLAMCCSSVRGAASVQNIKAPGRHQMPPA